MKHFIILFFLFTLLGCGSGKEVNEDLATLNPIQTQIDLTQVSDDKLPVVVNPGRFVKDTVVFRLPRVVQGTYAISDFGLFIEDFKALDYEGNELPFKKIDANTWEIYRAKKLEKISYWVNDTFDIEGSAASTPFSPSGTNIESENYVLNLHGFIGYFDSLKSVSYILDIRSPIEFDRTSAMTQIQEIESEDGKSVTTRYKAERYFEITDNPMMYGKLDVENFTVGDIDIVLSVYSPTGKHSANKIKETIFKMMEAQKAYLGDINSTKRYDIYIFLAGNGVGAPTGYGALEHHTSTVLVMPESMDYSRLEGSLIDIISHEFFHILTPLSLHSEDVHYFDYNQPAFSKHLWMYEGLTEYFAMLFQINQNLLTEEEFYLKLSDKIEMSRHLDDNMSFTEMSENILEYPYAGNYHNVYEKGALIGMCLDIIIRENSKGQRGILSVMKELSERYGVEKPFEDDSIIEEIVEMTYPEVGIFLEEHVIGANPIDYMEYFEKVGMGMIKTSVETNYLQSDGKMIVKRDRTNRTFEFTDEMLNNSFWKEAGARPGDIIEEVDGVQVTFNNGNMVFGKMFGWESGQLIDVKLLRGKEQIIIQTILTKTYTQVERLGNKVDASQEEKELRHSWLKQ